MRVMKKGDPIVIVGYESTIMTGIITDEGINKDDMSNPYSTARVDNDWVISPADCFLIEKDDLKHQVDDVRKKVLNANAKLGYYWMIELETKVPVRTLRNKQ